MCFACEFTRATLRCRSSSTSPADGRPANVQLSPPSLLQLLPSLSLPLFLFSLSRLRKTLSLSLSLSPFPPPSPPPLSSAPSPGRAREGGERGGFKTSSQHPLPLPPFRFLATSSPLSLFSCCFLLRWLLSLGARERRRGGGGGRGGGPFNADARRLPLPSLRAFFGSCSAYTFSLLLLFVRSFCSFSFFPSDGRSPRGTPFGGRKGVRDDRKRPRKKRRKKKAEEEEEEESWDPYARKAQSAHPLETGVGSTVEERAGRPALPLAQETTATTTMMRMLFGALSPHTQFWRSVAVGLVVCRPARATAIRRPEDEPNP